MGSAPRRWCWILAGMALLYAPARLPDAVHAESPTVDTHVLTGAVLAPTGVTAIQPVLKAPPVAPGRPTPGLVASVGVVLLGALVWVESSRPTRRHAHRGPPVLALI